MLVLISIFSSLALAICTALKPICLQNTVDAVGTNEAAILALFAYYVATILGILIFETIRQLSISKYSIKKTFSLKSRLINHVTQMSPQKFQKEKGQNYITVLNKEIDMLVENYYVTRLEFAYSVLVLITSIAALLYINTYLALIIIVSTACPILASVAQGKAIRKKTNLYTKALEGFNVMIGNLIQGYHTIKVNHAEQEYTKELTRSNETTAKAEFSQAKTKVRVNLWIGFLAYTGEAILVGFSIYQILKGALTIGALVGALQLSEMLAIPTNSISYQISDMNAVKGIRNKIHSLIDVATADESEQIQCPQIRSIELKDVSFRYMEKPVLQHVSYRFEAGKKYLIIGENGSGKSTLFKLLSRFEQDYEGQILVNGLDIRNIGPSFYDQVGIVLQDPFLFDDTLLNNITMYRPYSRESVEAVMLSLGMDDFLATHDLESEFQATKENISGGEKQKLALARILIQGKNVILLDEATSAIDKESSFQIESKLLHTGELTLISIEHKLIPELIPLYDVVLELKDFNLAERTNRNGFIQ